MARRIAALRVRAALRASLFLLLSGAAVLGCKSEKCPSLAVVSEIECTTTEDCANANAPELSCISGICRRPCLDDEDCVLTFEPGDDCANEVEPQGAVVCESQLCAPGCPDTPCADGESCVDGRCYVFFESFELPEGEAAVSFDSLGWNGLDLPLNNLDSRVVWRGPLTCVNTNLGDDSCAGPAGHGERFASIASVPTPEKGTPDVALTCRSCACCLECVLDTPNFEVRVPACPRNPGIPIALQCPGAVPGVCQTVCNECESCAMADQNQLGERLLSCEQDAATRTCTSCTQCDAPSCETCRSQNCPACATDIDSEACTTCEQAQCAACSSCRACNTCSGALSCELSDPNSAACIAKRVACDAQDTDGCYPTPINYPRAQLTDEEQALISPAIGAVAGINDPLVLQLEYVAFNVGEEYRPGVQGTPADQWPVRGQEVLVQLCAASCDQASSWTDATLISGDRASFPPVNQRRNGLSLGNQTSIDWRAGRVQVDLPQAMLTPQFRFRLVPFLEEDIRVGVDNIVIRRR